MKQSVIKFPSDLTSNNCTKTTYSLKLDGGKKQTELVDSSCVVHSLCFHTMWFFQWCLSMYFML